MKSDGDTGLGRIVNAEEIQNIIQEKLDNGKDSSNRN